MNALASVEIQMIMHGLDVLDILRFAGCNKFLRQTATHSFGWRHATSFQITMYSNKDILYHLNKLNTFSRSSSPISQARLCICLSNRIQTISRRFWESSTSIEEEETSQIINSILSHSRRVKGLCLQGIKINDEQMKFLSIIASDENSILTSLALTKCKIEETGILILSNAIKVNKTLTCINLNGNSIGPQGARVLAESIKHNTSITSISLKNNNIGDIGAIAIADVIKYHPTVTKLDVLWNSIGYAGMAVLDMAFSYNKKLTFVEFH